MGSRHRNTQPIDRRQDHGRRQDDFQRWWENRWTKLAALILFTVVGPSIGAAAKTAWDRWNGLPPITWVDRVETHVKDSEHAQVTIVQAQQDLNDRVQRLEKQVEAYHHEDKAAREQLSVELRALRTDLQRWFVAAIEKNGSQK